MSKSSWKERVFSYTSAALFLTILYVLIISFYQPDIFNWMVSPISSKCNPQLKHCVEFNQLGDLLAGIFSPLAFIWFASMALQQKKEVGLIAQREHKVQTSSYCNSIIDQYLSRYNDEYHILSDRLNENKSVIRYIHLLSMEDNSEKMMNYITWSTNPDISYSFHKATVHRTVNGDLTCNLKGSFVATWYEWRQIYSPLVPYRTPELDFDMWLAPNGSIFHTVEKLCRRDSHEIDRLKRQCIDNGGIDIFQSRIDSDWQLMMAYSYANLDKFPIVHPVNNVDDEIPSDEFIPEYIWSYGLTIKEGDYSRLPDRFWDENAWTATGQAILLYEPNMPQRSQYPIYTFTDDDGITVLFAAKRTAGDAWVIYKEVIPSESAWDYLSPDHPRSKSSWKSIPPA